MDLLTYMNNNPFATCFIALVIGITIAATAEASLRS